MAEGSRFDDAGLVLPDASHSPAPGSGLGRGRWAAPDEVWTAVRDDYLSGLSAPECCRRHAVKVSALRARAAREGWRRADQVWTPPHQLDPWDEGLELEDRVHGDLDRVEPHDLVSIADRRMTRAVLRGDATAVMRWHRVREVMKAEVADLERFIDAEGASAFHKGDRAWAEGAAARTEEVDSSDASGGLFDTHAGGARPI